MGLSNDLSCEAGSLSRCRPNPHGCFNQRSEALFPRTGTLGYAGRFAPCRSSRFICARVGPWGATLRSTCPVLCPSESGPLGFSVLECGAPGSATGHTACPVRPTLRQSQSRHSHASPLHPGARCPSPVSAPPTGLDECLFFISLVSDPLAVGFSVSSGCARRRSVSTYAAILVLCVDAF